jgi:radical SAM protein (TIGR01212 family)
METDLPFQTLRPWLLATFGRPVYRVALDAGSTCPNQDGSKGFGGCVYCDVEGSATGALRTGQALALQLSTGLARIARRETGKPVPGAIAYFQSYSNTYVTNERLREVLAVVEPHVSSRGGPVVAVSLATRPDTLPDDALAILGDLARHVPVWIELGLEASNDRVLEEIRRFQSAHDYVDAATRADAAGLLIVGHAILGLPGDGREGARATATMLAASPASGIKVHNLMVLKRTQLEKSWREGRVDVLDEASYVNWLADFVERLRPDQILHRLTSDAGDTERLAPSRNFDKGGVRERLAQELVRRGTRQGSHAASPLRGTPGAPAAPFRRG